MKKFNPNLTTTELIALFDEALGKVSVLSNDHLRTGAYEQIALSRSSAINRQCSVAVNPESTLGLPIYGAWHTATGILALWEEMKGWMTNDKVID
jgi:hypothetical protein